MKYTTKEFDRYLLAFEKGNTIWMNNAVRLVTSRALWSELCEDISDYRKQSLVRKVLRYVAQTALRGTFEIDGLSVSQSFCEMKDGDPVSFGTLRKWSFWSYRLNQTINVEIVSDKDAFSVKVAKFYDNNHELLMETEIWQGCHWTEITGRVDLVQHFEDIRNAIRNPYELSDEEWGF